MKSITMILSAFAAIAVLILTSMNMENSKKETGAYLEITIKVNEENRMNAGGVYVKYKEPFLNQIKGATTKELLI